MKTYRYAIENLCCSNACLIDTMMSRKFLRTLQVRTENALFEAIGTALCHVTADDALGWFHSCGYTDKQEKCTQI